MRTLGLLSLAYLIGLASAAAQQHFVSKTETELLTSADMDGDGDRDLVVVDQGNGLFTIGYAGFGGDIAWSPTQSSGLPGADDIATGLIETGNSAAWLAVTEADANKVHLIQAAASVPVVVNPSRPGPASIALPDIAGTGAPGVSDLAVATIYSGLSSHGLEFSKSSGNGPMAVYHTEALSMQAYERLNRFPLAPGGEHLAMIQRGVASDTLRVRVMDDASSLSEVFTLPDLPVGSDYLVAPFGPGGMHLVAYAAGRADFLVADLSLSSTATALSFDQAIERLFLLEEGAGNALLALYPGGDAFAIYDFDGLNAPVLREFFELAEGQEISGLLPGNGDQFHLLHRGAGSGQSVASTVFNLVDGQYVQGLTSAMPSRAGLPLGLMAQVVVYDVPPLITEIDQRVVLARHQIAGNWAASPVMNEGQLQVTASAFQGSSTGLQETGQETVPGPGLAANALVNQVAEDISVMLFSQSSGAVVANLSIAPPPGSYEHAVTPQIQSTSGTVTIFHRLEGASSWTAGGVPSEVTTLIEDTTLEYYAQMPGTGAKTPIYRARYTFPSGGGDSLDSDGDGVPDFVELSIPGLDPVDSGADSDGDGWRDLQEILEGTSPTDPASKPESSTANKLARFDIDAEPLSLSGGAFKEPIHAAASATAMRAYRTDGSLLDNATTSNGLAKLSHLPLDSDRDFIVVTTPTNFRIRNGENLNASEERGREMIALVPVPRVDERAYQKAPHSAGDAADWIAKTAEYYDNLAVITVSTEVSYKTTLAALLFERTLFDLSGSRPYFDLSTVTLTPYRGSEEASPTGEGFGGGSLGGSVFLRQKHWRALYDAYPAVPNNFDNGFDLRAIYRQIEQSVQVPKGAMIELTNLAREIYHVSASRAQLAPGAYQSPLDELRAYLQFSVLSGDPEGEEGYAAHVSGVDLAMASGAAYTFSPPPTRVLHTLNLRVPSGGLYQNAGCLTLIDEDTDQAVHLYDTRFQAYELESEVAWTPGTQFTATGYTLDATEFAFLPCPTSAYQIVLMKVVSLADEVMVTVDTDTNLLGDEWTNFFFPGQEIDPFGDEDGDGTNNLQEALDETDPSDASSFKASADLAPLDPEIEATGADSFAIVWDFPDDYAKFFVVEVLQGSSPADLEYLGDLADMSAEELQFLEDDTRRFYVLRMRRR